MATHNFKLMIITGMSSRHGTIDYIYPLYFILPQIYLSKIFQKLIQPLIQNIEVFILLVINQLSIYTVVNLRHRNIFSSTKILVKNNCSLVCTTHILVCMTHYLVRTNISYYANDKKLCHVQMIIKTAVHKIISCAPKILCSAKLIICPYSLQKTFLINNVT